MGLGSYFKHGKKDELLKRATDEGKKFTEQVQTKYAGPLTKLVFGDEGNIDNGKKPTPNAEAASGLKAGNHKEKYVHKIAEFRWSQMLREILGNDPDIITVQELDHYWDFMGPLLHSVGYKSHYQYKQKSNGESYTGGFRDGVAIFWKHEKFDFHDQSSEFTSPMIRVGLTTKGNAPPQTFDVFTAHMKSGDEECKKPFKTKKGKPDEGCEWEINEVTKAVQLKTVCGKCADTLVKKMDKVNLLAEWVKRHKRPFIISLDLNSNQRSIANRMLMAKLSKAKRTIYDTYADLGLSGCSTYKERWGGAQPEKIDKAVKAQRIDFIFRSSHWRTVKALAYPTKDELLNNTMPGHGPWLPNIKQGSDHFCAVATLRLYHTKDLKDLEPLVHGKTGDHKKINAQASLRAAMFSKPVNMGTALNELVARHTTRPRRNAVSVSRKAPTNNGKGNRRRRMAQREFSSRRDSPVMVRLLQEIVAAHNKNNNK